MLACGRRWTSAQKFFTAIRTGRDSSVARRRITAWRPRIEPLEDLTLPSFLAPVTYPVGLFTSSVAAADVNGDGIADLVASNGNGNDVSVLLGHGDGTFGAAIHSPVGASPNFVAVGDLNGDGIPDLVTANASPNGVSVLLGNGDGTFQPPRFYQAGMSPTNVVIGDFNGDGVLDLAVTNLGVAPDYQGTVSVLLGNGDGTFQPAVNYEVGSRPIPLVIGDFNGDGNPDLAIGNSFSSTVTILLGNGDGSFRRAADVPAGPFSASLAAGDFNGDGVVDLALTNDMTAGTLSVLLGNGDGSFQPRRIYATGAFPYGIVAADFNNDGIVDLAAANEGSGDVSVFLGNGNGTFQQQVRTAAGAGAQTIAVGDFNADPYPDLVVANRNINSVSVLINAADWSTDPINGPFISSTLPPCDNCSSDAVPLGFSFDFFGVREDTVWVNNNGNLTFGRPFNGFIPGPLSQVGQPILAPFWADVFTNGDGLGQVTYGPGTLDGDPAFGATWENVGGFGLNGVSNYFQIVIIDHSARLGYQEIQFNYLSIGWDHPTSSDQPPRAGYSNGAGTSLELPGSGLFDATLDNGTQSLRVLRRYTVIVYPTDGGGSLLSGDMFRHVQGNVPASVPVDPMAESGSNRGPRLETSKDRLSSTSTSMALPMMEPPSIALRQEEARVLIPDPLFSDERWPML